MSNPESLNIETAITNLKNLVESNRDISVLRKDTGIITINQNLENGTIQHLYLSVIPANQLDEVSSKKVLISTNNSSQPNNYSYIYVSKNNGEINAEVSSEDKIINPRDILATAIKGLKLFGAFKLVELLLETKFPEDSEVRAVLSSYNPYIYDEIGDEELNDKQTAEALGQLQEFEIHQELEIMGLTSFKTDPTLSQYPYFIMWILGTDPNIITIK